MISMLIRALLVEALEELVDSDAPEVSFGYLQFSHFFTLLGNLQDKEVAMNQTTQAEKHVPYSCFGILGCNGYKDTDKVICMTASGGNNFASEGIVEGSLLFIDTTCECQSGALNVFKYKAERTPQYKLSRRKIPHAAYVGKVLMAVNQY